MNHLLYHTKPIKKTRKRLSSLKRKSPRKDVPQDKFAASRCRFVEIPQPTKYNCFSSIIPLNGDTLLMEYNDQLVSEISLYNEYKVFKEVTVDEMFGQKVLTIRPISKIDKETLPHWTKVVEQLADDSLNDEEEKADWIRIIKEFSHTYNKVMQRQSRKKMKSGPRKKFFNDVTLETEKQKKQLLETYPCLFMKFRVKSHQNQLKEIMFTENFLQELNYSMDDFAISILTEGLPQLMPIDNPLSAFVTKPLLDNYFTIPHNGYESQDIQAPMLTKNGFARDITFKAHFFVNYESNTFGLDIILTLQTSGEPYIINPLHASLQLNPIFVQDRVQKESEAECLLTRYYNLQIHKKYTDMDKVCLIKDIESDDDFPFVVKKLEE